MRSALSDLSDAELVRRSLAGEHLAFAQLVEKHQRLVFGVALSNARDAIEAEDVAQEAFAEAWRELRTLRDPTRVGTWVAGIARNLAHRWRRRTARRRNRETTAVDVEIDASATPLDAALERETTLLIRTALAAIAEAYREVLVLYYVQGRSVRELATGLGISEDLAKQRLSRGRRALRTSLERRVEDALGELGPSKTFTAAVMVSVTAATVRTARAAGSASAAGKALLAMKVTKFVVVGIALALVAGVAWRWQRRPSAIPPHPDEPMSNAAAAPHSVEAAKASRDAGSPTVRKLARREMREQLLSAIRTARDLRVAKMHTSAAAAQPAPLSAKQDSVVVEAHADDADADYIRVAMTALLPMVVDCYKQARVSHPALAGTLVVNFTIEGEPGVGGVVTQSTIDPETSEIKDPDLGQCVQETMFALEIDPPTNGGTVKVTFPFTFRRKD
jgi:RNA polymerase sigma factor (sigma-70 family)